MVGTQDDPGLMVLSLRDIFSRIQRETESEFEVTCSYLEVYNEVIYDLLERSSGHLELREDPEQGITVAGLQRIEVTETFRLASVHLLFGLGSERETLNLSVDLLVLPWPGHAYLYIGQLGSFPKTWFFGHNICL